MNETKTRSMLQRLPVILAVTAASYGLPVQAQTQRIDRSGAMQSSASDHVGRVGPQPARMAPKPAYKR